MSNRTVAMAGVLLLGILLLGFGYYEQRSVVFYTGLLAVVWGVLIGTLRIVVDGKR